MGQLGKFCTAAPASQTVWRQESDLDYLNTSLLTVLKDTTPVFTLTLRALVVVSSFVASLDPTCRNLGRQSERDIWWNVAKCAKNDTHTAKAKDGDILPGEMHVGMFLQTIGHVSRTKHSAVFTAESAGMLVERGHFVACQLPLCDHIKNGNWLWWLLSVRACCLLLILWSASKECTFWRLSLLNL